MLKLTKQQINEIAQMLDADLNIYVHKENAHILEVPNLDEGDDNIELWEDVVNEINNNGDKYLQLYPLDTNKSYKLMEHFSETVQNKELRLKLEYALTNSKPFHNFKYEIDFYGGNIRQKWFAFKEKRYEVWVTQQIKEGLENR